MEQATNHAQADTIIQRKKKITHVSISDAEIALLLKGYQLHPCSWDRILNYVTERCENLPDEALKYYKVATIKQLKSRLSIKLGKLQQTPLSSIANESIGEELTKVMSLENKLRKPTQGQMPAAVVDEIAVQPPQEPDNVADDHREQIINNLSDEDIPLTATPQIPGQNIPKPSTSSASERKRQIDNELQNIEAPKAKKHKSASLIDTIKQNHMDYRKFITKKMPKILRAIGISSSSESEEE